MNRRSFAKRSVVACAALLGSTSSLTVAAEKTPEPAGLAESCELIRPADLELEASFHTDEHWGGTRRTAHCRVRVPGLEVVHPLLLPKTSKTRAYVGIRFMTRSVKVANVEIELLDKTHEGRVIYRDFRTEVLGPEKVVTKGRTWDSVRHWDDFRDLWFDFPVDARDTAKAIRVKVRLERA